MCGSFRSIFLARASLFLRCDIWYLPGLACLLLLFCPLIALLLTFSFSFSIFFSFSLSVYLSESVTFDCHIFNRLSQTSDSFGACFSAIRPNSARGIRIHTVALVILILFVTLHFAASNRCVSVRRPARRASEEPNPTVIYNFIIAGDEEDVWCWCRHLFWLIVQYFLWFRFFASLLVCLRFCE